MKKLKLPEEKKFVGPALIWKRLIAFLIDVLLLDIIFSFVFRGAIGSMIPEDATFWEKMSIADTSNYEGLYSLFIAIFLLSFLYFFTLEKRYGQTIGKKIFNIYVIAENEKLNYWQAFVRNMGFVPFLFLPIILFLDPFFMAFSKTGQTLSEMLSRTKSVEVFSYGNEVM